MSSIEDILFYKSKRNIHQLKKINIPKPHKIAAESILSFSNQSVFLFTGFYVNRKAETDGPVGTFVLAEVLRKLGFFPVIFTDSYCQKYFGPLEKYEIKSVFENDVAPPVYFRKYRPSCLISIERPGRAKDGEYYNMYNKKISKYTLALDQFFIEAENYFTIGIGDGGNEIGMGKFANMIQRQFTIVPSIVDTDVTILSTVSNWGAYGLARCLELISMKNLMMEYDKIKQYYQYIKRCGAVDGVTGKNELSVDGFGLNEDELVYNNLRKVKEI